MADLVQTPASVRIGATKTLGRGIAGEAMVAGQPVYRKAADNKLWLGSCDVTAAEANIEGITTHPTGAEQTIEFQKLGEGEMNIGAALVTGAEYALSAAVGKICPVADLVATNFITYFGHAKSASLLDLTRSKVTGLQKPPFVLVEAHTEGNGTSINEKQQLWILGAGGTFTLTFDNTGSNPQTTSALAWNINAAALEVALEALSNITAATVTGTGTKADPFVVTFLDAFTNFDLMTTDYALLT